MSLSQQRALPTPGTRGAGPMDWRRRGTSSCESRFDSCSGQHPRFSFYILGPSGGKGGFVSWLRDSSSENETQKRFSKH